MRIAIIKGDLRQNYIERELYRLDMELYWIDEKEPVWQEDTGAVILPVRPSEELCALVKKKVKPGFWIFGGALNRGWCRELVQEGSLVFDYLKDPQVERINGQAVAQGVLGQIIAESKVLVEEMRILLIGYGKCGSAIGELLKLFGPEILVVEKEEKGRWLAGNWGYETVEDIKSVEGTFDVIINTVPELVLDQSALERIRSRYTILDIASKEGGVDYKYCEKNGIRTSHMLRIPAKNAPGSCGRACGKAIFRRVKESRNELE